MQQNQYRRLSLMFVLHFAIMYVLMYAMVDSFAHAYLNLNQAYMAALMAAPMVMLELWLMRPMYPKKEVNSFFLLAAAGIALLSFFLIRTQAGVGDEQFLRSMIPHHSGALLMCGEAAITDENIRALCDNIVASQGAEIGWMAETFEFLGESQGGN